MNNACRWEQCGKPGKLWPTVLLWARGRGPGDHDPMRMEFGLAICAEHMDQVTVDNLIPPDARLDLIMVGAQLGRAPPRFDNAQIEWNPVGNPAWNNLLLATAGDMPGPAGRC